MYIPNTTISSTLHWFLVSAFLIVGFVLWSPSAEARIVIEGDRQFTDDINECFNTYRNVPGIVGDVIRELENSENEHRILNSEEWNNTSNDLDEATGGGGSGTVTRVDKEKLEEYVETIESLRNKDFCTALLHELYHAVDADRGTRTPHSDRVDGAKRNEVEATLFQNLIHAIRGVPPRTHYGGIDISEHVVIGNGEFSQEPPVPPEVETIQAIEYNGKHLPLDQLIVESEVGCGADHYHAATGVVTAVDGTVVPDPGPQCGYGKVSDRPTVVVPAG